jgi:hypothetical protein
MVAQPHSNKQAPIVTKPDENVVHFMALSEDFADAACDR